MYGICIVWCIYGPGQLLNPTPHSNVSVALFNDDDRIRLLNHIIPDQQEIPPAFTHTHTHTHTSEVRPASSLAVQRVCVPLQKESPASSPAHHKPSRPFSEDFTSQEDRPIPFYLYYTQAHTPSPHTWLSAASGSSCRETTA